MGALLEILGSFISKILAACLPTAAKIIAVSAEMLEAKLEARLAEKQKELETYRLDHDLTKAIKASAHAVFGDGAAVSEEVLDNFVKNHIDNAVMLVAQHAQNSNIPFMEYKAHSSMQEIEEVHLTGKMVLEGEHHTA